MPHRFVIATVALVTLVLSTAPSFAQTRATTGDIVGVVRDPSGAVLPAATVTATHVETNLSRTTITGPEGRFVLPALSLGSYTVSVELAGFALGHRKRCRGIGLEQRSGIDPVARNADDTVDGESRGISR